MIKSKMKIKDKKNKIYSLKGLLTKLFKSLNKRTKFQLLILLLMLILSYGAETFSFLSIVSFLSIITNESTLTTNKFAQIITTSFNISDSNQIILLIALFFSFGILISAFLRILTNYLNMNLAANVGTELSCKAYYKTINQSYENHIEINSSELINGTMTETARSVSFIEYVLMFLTSLGLVLVLLTVLVILQGISALILGVVLFLVYLSIGKFFKKRLARYSDIFSILSRKHIKIMQESIGSIRDLLIGNNQNIYAEIYRKNDREMRLIDGKSNLIAISPKYLIEAISFILIILIAIISYDYQEKSLIILKLSTVAYGAQRLIPALQQTFLGWAKLNSHRSSVEAVLKLIDRDVEKINIIKVKSKKIFTNKIELKNIYYRYKNATKNTLNNINLTINKGERIGIVGKTGCGKSTLLDIMMGLLNPEKGEILIDGVDICKNINEKRIWRDSLSHVPQSIFLSDNSILENIAFGLEKNRIDLEKINKVSEQADLLEFVLKKLKKFETIIGEKGIKLSGGQRQRIGIARALYKDYNCLILDEATSALDINTERKILKSLEMVCKNITIIMVTHRIKTLESFDKVYSFDEDKKFSRIK